MTPPPKRRKTVPIFEGYSSREVPFVGPQPADFLLLGEAPGRDEDDTGRPFVGQAGLLLSSLCSEAGLDRATCRIGNSVPRRPPANKKPTPSEIRFYRERLVAEIEATKPKVIVALGDSPLFALTGRRGITKHRGMEITTPEGWLVLPTFHPAYVLPNRSPSARVWLVEDLRKARRLAGAGPTGVAPRMQLLTHPLQIGTLDRECDLSVLAYDVETTGLDPLDPEQRMLGVGIAWSPDEGAYVLPAAWEALRPIIAKAKRLIAHNGPFDNRWLRREGFEVRQTFDTMLAASHLDDSRPTYKLERLAVEMLDIPPYHQETDTLLNEGKGREIDPAVLGMRCVYDACYTLRLYLLLRERLIASPEATAAFRHLVMPSARLAEGMMDAGLPLDLPLLAQRQQVCAQRAAETLARLRDIAGDPGFNPGSPQQVGKVLVETLRLPIAARTPTGRVATGEDVLAHYPHDPFVAGLQEYRQIKKYQSTYYDKWSTNAREGRIHGTFWVARSDDRAEKMRGTRTGRFSGDLQQTPKQFNDTPEVFRVKDIVLAPEGYSLVEVDLSQIELRVIAWLAPEPAMRAAYQEGRDLHIETARDVLGIQNPTQADRSKAKPINFGFIYGMGENHFQEYALTEYGISFTLDQVVAIKQRFFEKYRGLPAYYRRCEREAREAGAIRTPFGRTRRLPDARNPLMERRSHALRQAINTPIQGTASDINLLAAVAAQARAPQRARLLLLVHDSSLWEVQEDQAMAFAQWLVTFIRRDLRELIRQRFGAAMTVPLDAEAKVGRCWGRMETVENT